MITNQNNLASMIAQYRAQQPAQQAPQPVAQPQPQPMQSERMPLSLAWLYSALGQKADPGIIGGFGGGTYDIHGRPAGVGMRPNWF